MKKQVVILGAGISGLSAAWFLKKKYGSDIQCTILEKKAKCGGWIQTQHEKGFVFEKGPRSFRTLSLSPVTIKLIQELKLEAQIIPADVKASKRFIYTADELHSLPDRLWKIPFSSLTTGWFKVLCNEWQQKKRMNSEESVADFFVRHLSQAWTDRLIDPFISGIFAGDVHQLSMQSCFPQLVKKEQEYGSLLKSFLYNKKEVQPPNLFVQKINSPLFSFINGMQTLTDALADDLKEQILLNTEIDQLALNLDSVEIKLLDGTTIVADHLISTLPTYQLAQLIRNRHPYLKSDLDKINYASIMVVNLGYHQNVLKQKGFGYLVPSKENEKVLGCIWDSAVFPQQNLEPEMTRLTVMLGGVRYPENATWSEEKGVALALAAMEKHLALTTIPDYISVYNAVEAIPQFNLGYAELMQHIEKQISFITNSMTCVGSAFNGVSVNDCIQNAYDRIENLQIKF